MGKEVSVGDTTGQGGFDRGHDGDGDFVWEDDMQYVTEHRCNYKT